MDFIEDETRPKFLFQSRPAAAGSSPAANDPASVYQNKALVSACVSLSLVFLASSIFLLQSDLLRSLSLWISISLLLGPFAPPSFTGGDIRVGCGEIVDFPPPQEDPAPVDDSRKKRQKAKRSEELGLGKNSNSNSIRNGSVSQQRSSRSDDPRSNSVNGGLEREKDSAVEEREWTDEDIEMLKKQILKNPVGKPRRWEVIAEAFNGRHSVQSVIKMSKSMGEAKPEDSDAYSKFLKNRKPVDKRVEDQISGESTNAGVGGEVPVTPWSSGEDIALLNALKTFPKEVTMRWEKIAVAVPGRSKAACMKRVTELKRDFRSSKSAVAADS